jgi:glycogen debranching enzyme
MGTVRAGCLLLLVTQIWLSGCGADPHSPDGIAGSGPEALAQLAVGAVPGEEKAMMFADRAGTFYYDALADPQHNDAMGFVAGGFRLFDGWHWFFPEDSVGLGGADMTRGFVRPDFAVRRYVEGDTAGFLPRLIRRFRGPAPKHLTETIALGEGALLISISDSLGAVELLPAFSDRPDDGYSVEFVPDGFAVARSNYLEPRGDSPRPVWVAVVGEDARALRRSMDLARHFPGSMGVRTRAHAPARLQVQTPSSVAFAYGMTAEEAVSSARRALAQREQSLQNRQQWAQQVLYARTLQTSDQEFNRAYDWARLTLEQLVRGDSAHVDLLPGIPGAEAQHGWNTVQALEGAFLATGQWERAAGMLRLYASRQRFDQRIDVFGRAPSRFDITGTPRYRTADGAAVLVAALGDYLRVAGNENLVLGERRLFWTNPVFAQRGYNDPRQMRTQHGFIRNDEGQTWVQQIEAQRGMGVRGPESVEVQARYYQNLRTMERLAIIMGVRGQAQEYAATAAEFQRAFERAFIQDDRVVDHRDADARPSPIPRPSGLYALQSFDLDPEVERRLLRRIAGELVYEHGVSTRPQTDSLFYPFLDAPDHYEPDAARYEGAVWTALSGPLVSLLVKHGAPQRAYEQTQALINHLLERGVVGGIPENVDPHPRDGRLGVGGAPVQPWSLAEFLRNAHQDYLGVKYLAGNMLVLEPNMPASWGETTSRIRVRNGWVRTTVRQRGNELAVSLVPEGQLPREAVLRVRAFGVERHVPLAREIDREWFAADSTSLTITPNGITHDGEEVQPDATYEMADTDFWDGFSWVQPDLRDEYPVMQRLEEERRLVPEQVTTINPTAVTILARTDPVGDDWGPTATYTYPTTYPPGILDATYLQIAEDRDAYYFRIEMAALARGTEEIPHQPTFFALTLDVEEGGQGEVGRNANYRFPRGTGFNYVIYIGDGLRVEDERGRVLGEFAATEADILDIETAVVEFALPKFVIPSIPRGSQVTLLVGANDGGAAPGRFQTVGAQATARRGGGKVHPRDPNIYDVVASRVR